MVNLILSAKADGERKRREKIMTQTLRKAFDMAILAAVLMLVVGFTLSAMAGETNQNGQAHAAPVANLTQVLASAQ